MEKFCEYFEEQDEETKVRPFEFFSKWLKKMCGSWEQYQPLIVWRPSYGLNILKLTQFLEVSHTGQKRVSVGPGLGEHIVKIHSASEQRTALLKDLS